MKWPKPSHYFRRNNIERILPKYYSLVMILTWKEIVEKQGGISKAYSSVRNGKYKKVSHGVYVDGEKHVGELEQLFARYPRATLTLQSAFYYYDLSDYIPDKYYFVTPYNAHTISNPKVIQTYMNEETMKIGRITIKTKYGSINIFDKERMLVELFRLKVKLDHAYFLEIVSSYRKLKINGELSLYLVGKYCKKLPRGEKILKEIQEMI